jgi:hypothetical protein
MDSGEWFQAGPHLVAHGVVAVQAATGRVGATDAARLCAAATMRRRSPRLRRLPPFHHFGIFTAGRSLRPDNIQNSGRLADVTESYHPTKYIPYRQISKTVMNQGHENCDYYIIIKRASTSPTPNSISFLPCSCIQHNFPSPWRGCRRAVGPPPIHRRTPPMLVTCDRKGIVVRSCAALLFL